MNPVMYQVTIDLESLHQNSICPTMNILKGMPES